MIYCLVMLKVMGLQIAREMALHAYHQGQLGSRRTPEQKLENSFDISAIVLAWDLKISKECHSWFQKKISNLMRLQNFTKAFSKILLGKWRLIVSNWVFRIAILSEKFGWSSFRVRWFWSSSSVRKNPIVRIWSFTNQKRSQSLQTDLEGFLEVENFIYKQRCDKEKLKKTKWKWKCR